MTLINQLKNTARFLKNGLQLFQGRFTADTHQALIFWHCQTNGYFTDWLFRLNKEKTYAIESSNMDSLFSQSTLLQASGIVTDLNKHGFHVLQEKLGGDICNRMIDVMATAPAHIRRKDSMLTDHRKPSHIFEEPPQGTIYDCSLSDLIESEVFQALVSEPLFLRVAEEYLQTLPKLDPCNAWWTVAAADKDTSYAQDYHFDMDTVRWFKVFVYLSDVTKENGPHCFIKGSHKSGSIPYALRKKGYSRLSDQEVFTNFTKNDEQEFTGPKGTVIFEDTRGLHKGQPVVTGSRLILSLQFSNILFQHSDEQLSMNHHENLSWKGVIPVSQNFKYLMQRYPGIYRRYLPCESQAAI